MSTKTCSYRKCNRKVYGNTDKCILHCDKNKEEPYKEFTGELDSLIQENINNKVTQIKLETIVFPNQEKNMHFIGKLNKLEAIHFYKCQFMGTTLALNENVKSRFENCTFHNNWHLYNLYVLNSPSIFDDNYDVLYKKCIFKQEIKSKKNLFERKKRTIEAKQFDNCKFHSIQFSNTTFKEQVFNGMDNRFDESAIISIDNCSIENKFVLNKHKVEKLEIKDTIFKSKFEFRENNEVSMEIINSNFEGIFDCNLNIFSSFYMEKSIFYKFVGFEESIFEAKNGLATTFKYVSFLDYSYFRGAKFNIGLDLETTNMEVYPNFLNAYIEPKNTNRETFRIIKYSFDNIGNTIEANKYFAYEMNKERENKDNSLDKKILLNLNYWISNFGQSWLRPMLLIIIFAFIHTLLFKAIDSNTFQFIDSSLIKSVINFLNDVVKNMIPLKKSLAEGKEFISLMFLIVYSVLIYNLVIALKRTTKR
ncbi:MAG TPA: hypothetical protein ENK66_06970 [Arcobacter sp.]|nr:hypothetical protein [Arcobacter sp.]